MMDPRQWRELFAISGGLTFGVRHALLRPRGAPLLDGALLGGRMGSSRPCEHVGLLVVLQGIVGMQAPSSFDQVVACLSGRTIILGFGPTASYSTLLTCVASTAGQL